MSLSRRAASTVLIWAMVSAGSLSGQPPEPVSDLELSVVVEAESVTPPGSTGRLTFTVTNHGPDQAGSLADDFFVWVFADSFPFSVNHGALIIFTRVPETACRLGWTVPDPIPGDDPVIFYLFWFFELQPGESAVCALDFRVNPFADSFADDFTIPNTWQARVFRGEDPNPANDEVTVIFRLAATSDIPTLSPAGLLVLALSISMASLVLRYRRLGRPRAYSSHKD